MDKFDEFRKMANQEGKLEILDSLSKWVDSELNSIKNDSHDN